MHEPRTMRRRAAGAAILGNLLEWYDFVVYSYFAMAIAKAFFPSGDETAALLATFAAFGIGFVARPLGAIVLGRLGETRGRKFALIVTIALMAVGTVMIGIAPTYAAIGVTAPVILVAARLMQGFAVGGEWGNAVAYLVEWAPPDRRGFYGSLHQMT